jgi:hypothetical protein
MANPLSLTLSNARTVIEMSEGKEPGPGHTKARHVSISNADLRLRHETVTTGGSVHFLGAFIDIHDCAQALVWTLNALQTHPSVRNFDSLADGTGMNIDFPVMMQQPMKVRYCLGTISTQYTRIFGQKMDVRPHKLHLITFYPTFVLPV